MPITRPTMTLEHGLGSLDGGASWPLALRIACAGNTS